MPWTSFRSLLPRDLAGVFLFDDLSANSAAVDDDLAPVDRGFRRKRERIGNIEGPVGGLVEDLVENRLLLGAIDF